MKTRFATHTMALHCPAETQNPPLGLSLKESESAGERKENFYITDSALSKWTLHIKKGTLSVSTKTRYVSISRF